MASRTPRSNHPRTREPSAAAIRYRPHPWHGLDVGPNPPDIVHAFIEITPFDLMKYEIDKVSGYLKIDRPQRSSSQPPTLYGFVPRTYCDERVRKLAKGSRRGDGDPLDICVLSERAITRNEILLRCRVIGGLKMIDDGEADDKIVAVLENDYVWGAARDVRDVPAVLIERLQHYFLTYKLVPGERSPVRVAEIYGRNEARRVVTAAMADYAATFFEPPSLDKEGELLPPRPKPRRANTTRSRDIQSSAQRDAEP